MTQLLCPFYRSKPSCIHARYSINPWTNVVIDILSPAIDSFDAFRSFRLLLRDGARLSQAQHARSKIAVELV
jgi:hypothetical protein